MQVYESQAGALVKAPLRLWWIFGNSDGAPSWIQHTEQCDAPSLDGDGLDPPIQRTTKFCRLFFLMLFCVVLLFQMNAT